MSIKNLFGMYYWFSQPYIAHGRVLWFLVGGFLLVTVVGLGLRLVSHYQKDKINASIIRRFSSLSITMGILGLIWMFFRQERIPLLSWRFWLLIFLAIFVWWFTNVLRFTLKRAPELKREQAERARLGKYLPGRN